MLYRKRTWLYLFCVATVLAYQDAYEVIQERFTEEYHDPSVLDFYCGVYKFNRTTNAINISLYMKHDVSEHDMSYVTGYKFLSNLYRLDIIQFQNTIKDIMDIKYFDIDRLLHNYTKPPLVWPVKRGVTYRMLGWIPDSRQFPPGIPEGRWRIQLNFTKPDKTNFVVLSWYFKIQYIIRWT